MQRLSRIVVSNLAFAAVSMVMAQSPQPAAVMRILREDIKPGKSAAHEKTEAAFVRAFSKTNYPHYTALVSTTGPTHALFLERYDSFAALEKAMAVTGTEPFKSVVDQVDAQDGEVRTGERNMIATYRQELSYTPVPPNLPKYRFYNITTVRVRPGHSDDFEALTKLLSAYWEKIGSKQRRVVYGVTSGAPGGTYLILSGMETLASMDPPRPAKSGAEAFGAEEWARYQKLLADIVVSTEYILYSVSPKMSYPPKEFIDADPDFWAPKPKPAAAKPAAK
jgi:quinol monooxygenase YgiN